MDKLSLAFLTDAVSEKVSMSSIESSASSGLKEVEKGSGAQRRKAKRARWAAGEDEEGHAKHLARKQAKEGIEEMRRERRRVRREERLLAGQLAALDRNPVFTKS